MARHRTRRGGAFGMFKKNPLSSSGPAATESALHKDALRLDGALSAKNEVVGRMDSQGNAVFGQNNPMFKRAGRRKTRRTTRKSRTLKKVARRR